jgi:hypothetical protein
MALDVSGIGNVGEFFSQHYVDALLESDLKHTFRRWTEAEKEQKTKPPMKRLASLADTYFRLAARAQGETHAPERLALAREFHANLLAALGYERKPELLLLDDDRVVPVLLSVRKFHGSISAEHGVGELKVDKLEHHKSPVALSMMRAIKQALDPKNVMNPGRVLRA